MIGGELCQKLVVGDSGRCREGGLRKDLGSDLVGDFRRGPDALQIFGHIEIGLVQRQWFDQRRVLGEDFPDLKRYRLVSNRRSSSISAVVPVPRSEGMQPSTTLRTNTDFHS
jgi:hypothetical protein